MSQHHDALILGSGQAGTPLATHLKSLNQSVCLVERSHIAGCCVNEGCTPTKTMVASGRIAHLARRAKDYGVETRGEVQVDMQKVRRRKRDIVESFRGGSERRLGNAGVDVLMGEARFTGPKNVIVKLDGGDEKSLAADKIYINTGCRPSRPDIPGLDTVDASRVLDSTSIQELGEVPRHLVVIGGGYIGLEFAQLFRRLGANVTLVHRGGRLLSRNDDPELVECMYNILVEDGIDIHLNTTPTSISSSETADLPIALLTSTLGGKQDGKIQGSHLLVATGRVPNTDTLGLSAAGIQTSPAGHVVVDPTLETNVPGVYALGDVKGGPAFTHVSYDDFRIVRDNLAVSTSASTGSVRTTKTREALTPSVVYTDPQFAHIGPKWGSLPPGRYVTYSMPGSWIARGLETDETRGMLKAVVDAKSDQIVSFSAVSVEGGELMAVVQVAMLGRLTWRQLQDGVFAHPSWTEALNNLWGGEKKEMTIN